MLYSEIKNHKSLFVDSGAITPFSHFHLFQCDGDHLKNKIILQFLFAPSNAPSALGGKSERPKRNPTEFGEGRPGMVWWRRLVKDLEFPYRRWRRVAKQKERTVDAAANST